MKKLVEVVNLKKHFRVGKNQILKAVNDVSIHIYQGETLGVVGESGCGKTTLGRTVVRLYQPTAGKVLFNGLDIHKAAGQEKKGLFRRIQMIFQDPYASLNPRMTVGEIIGEALDIHKIARGSQRRDRIMELLKLVGLNADHTNRFPHEFSGGQRQRIGIARALAVDPEFIVCDEPISALDVSIQAQVVNLLEELQERLGLTYMFIAHDLSMVRHISSRVAVMYLGRVVELAGSDELYDNPLHPYTRALLSSIPVADPDIEAKRKRIILAGDVPSPVNPPPGCAFVTRCPQATKECHQETPAFKEIHDNHLAACHRLG
ncbi:oligopeptide transport system ATP-binding protein [Desulfotomaculum arcticum]|uniref:Oligopeptide transport system ATP-binding protein n=1 Tax=Desulfotruncus arcticus DSM 17038 TaxID=1121424 RepID=A0A1I2XDK9_9FIRM|nr:oligopeptide/dipeptide ABC transporter ATP-binding protein [Desulfotruncus arcticus]SFH11583.1 oligopeptide transport system ATP-binding protein [Desulfotomaculum arcticum] [Desulfotruncus arcticus DSM 17038]